MDIYKPLVVNKQAIISSLTQSPKLSEQLKQNLTKEQLKMVLSRLGKDSIMILCGDKYQVDLKFKNDSATHEVPKLRDSKWVNEIILIDNHRHEALDDILNRLND
jgi:predicted ribonuclease YlaK